MQQQQPQRRVLPHTIDATCEAALGCQEKEGECGCSVCVQRCALLRKNILLMESSMWNNKQADPGERPELFAVTFYVRLVLK